MKFSILFCLGAGILLVTVLKNQGFIRGFLGDILIVIFIYCGIKVAFPLIKPILLSPAVFAFACTVELLQYFNIPQYFDTKSLVIILTLGSTFDPWDIFMYAFGVGMAAFCDLYLFPRIFSFWQA